MGVVNNRQVLYKVDPRGFALILKPRLPTETIGWDHSTEDIMHMGCKTQRRWAALSLELPPCWLTLQPEGAAERATAGERHQGSIPAVNSMKWKLNLLDKICQHAWRWLNCGWSNQLSSAFEARCMPEAVEGQLRCGEMGKLLLMFSWKDEATNCPLNIYAYTSR